MPDVTIPHLAVPFSFAGPHNSARVNDQDSPDDIAACAEAVLRYQPGTRLALPGFGVSDQTFSREPDLDEIEVALEEYEPRASATLDDVTDDLLAAGSIDDAVQVIRVALEGG
jgi:hypothetical protein